MSEIALRLSPRLRNRLLGKLILITVLSALAGYALAAEFASDLAKGNALTLELYTADYDAYRAGLLESTQWPTWGLAMLSFFMLGCVVVVYEVLGAGFGWAMGKLWAPGETKAQPEAPTTTPYPCIFLACRTHEPPNSMRAVVRCPARGSSA